jgi:gas vesicle protein GvpL/GvpF
VIELVAISEDPAPPPPPLYALRCGRLTAICQPAERRPVSPDSLWRHLELVESLMATRDLLPVRFGTLVADDEAAARAIRDRQGELAADLERVRGAVELALRVTCAEDDPPRGADVERLVHEPLAFVVRESALLGGPELLRAAYLVECAGVPRFVSLVERLRDGSPQLDFLCTGPWPPYSFAQGARS